MGTIKGELSIVIFANKKDFFFTKLCVSSIRYYYPDIKIYLVKDKLNGNFNTKRLRRCYKVDLLHLDKKYFGWAAAKIHFLLDRNIPTQQYLCLDSDIIFAGRVLEKFRDSNSNFIVNPHLVHWPLNEYEKRIYLNPEKIKLFFPDYEYPGFFFNAGHTIVTPGLIDKNILKDCFDPDHYPYYKNREIFPTVDQSILNAILPVLEKRGSIKLKPETFMALAYQFFKEISSDNFEKYMDGKVELLIHYCGEIRNHRLEKMAGIGVLSGFRKQYYSRLSNKSRVLDKLQDSINSIRIFTYLLQKRNRLWIEILERIS